MFQKTVFKTPCAGNRSLHIRIRKKQSFDPKKRVQETMEEETVVQISVYQKPYSVSDRLKNHPKSHILRSHILPRRTFFGSGCLGPGFLDTVLRILFFGPRFLDTDFGYGFFGSGFGIWFFGYVSRKPEPKKPYPKQHIQKARTQKTVSAKLYPESRHP